MNTISKIALTALRTCGITGFLLHSNLKKQKVVMYHGTHSDSVGEDPLSFGISETEFRDSIKYLIELGFNFINPTQYFNGKPGILLTFDDCYSNNKAIALPILEEYGIPAVIFVTLQHLRNKHETFSDFLPYFQTQCPNNDKSEFIEKNSSVIKHCWNGATYSELVEMASHELITIGAHTINHPNLPDLSVEEQKKQILNSKLELEDIIGKSVSLFSYPYGNFTAETANLVAENFEYGFSVYHNESNVPKRFQIPRIGLYQASRTYLVSSMVYR